MTRTMYDAAWPPASPPRTDIVAFYVGGDTPHIWSDTEIARQTARWRLPIWVRSNPDQADPSIDAERTVAWLVAHQVPRGVVVALDLETAVNPRYVATYTVAVLRAGWLVMKYGSESTIFRNPSTPGGTWVADYNGDAIIDLGAVADQFAANVPPGVDLSTVADSVALWDTRPPPPPPSPPPPVVEPRGDLMLHTLSLRTDANGDGWLATTIPWSTFQAISMMGSNPATDHTVWPGSAKVQNLGETVFVTVYRFLPNSTARVFVLATT